MKNTAEFWGNNHTNPHDSSQNMIKHILIQPPHSHSHIWYFVNFLDLLNKT